MTEEFKYQYSRYEAIILQGNTSNNANILMFPIVMDRDIDVIRSVCRKYNLEVEIKNVDNYFGTATINYRYTTSELLRELQQA